MLRFILRTIGTLLVNNNSDWLSIGSQEQSAPFLLVLYHSGLTGKYKVMRMFHLTTRRLQVCHYGAEQYSMISDVFSLLTYFHRDCTVTYNTRLPPPVHPGT